MWWRSSSTRCWWKSNLWWVREMRILLNRDLLPERTRPNLGVHTSLAYGESCSCYYLQWTCIDVEWFTFSLEPRAVRRTYVHCRAEGEHLVAGCGRHAKVSGPR
jgi:hypothetical protein